MECFCGRDISKFVRCYNPSPSAHPLDPLVREVFYSFYLGITRGETNKRNGVLTSLILARFLCVSIRITGFSTLVLAPPICGKSGDGIVASPLVRSLNGPGWQFYYYSLEEKRRNLARSPCGAVFVS